MDSDGGEHHILCVIDHGFRLRHPYEESPDEFSDTIERNLKNSVIDGHNGKNTATGLTEVDTKREIRRARYSGPIVPMDISADDGCESPTRGVLNP